MVQRIKSASILVVDDDLGVRESLKMILMDKYYVSTASNIDEAIDSLKIIEPELIFLDIKISKENGLDFLKQIHSDKSNIPVVMITAFPSSQTAITAFRSGAFDYIIKPFEPSEIYTTVERALQHRIESYEKDKLVYNLRSAVHKNFFSTTESLLLAIDAKDSYTAGHSKRVSLLFGLIMKELGMNEAQIAKLRYGAFLHDIGKIGVRDDILTKTDDLTEEEFFLMKQHPEIGYNILEPINFLKEALPIVRYHHEWYNGKGYPHGLVGEAIPQEVAIFSVIDAYDALTTDRYYRKKYSNQEAFKIITEGIGTQFMPILAEKVLSIIKKCCEIWHLGGSN
ncbi:MAG: response regulator [Planctomycetes bacterium]|uniref:HD-GYP domain-containing protein n=1 Tax=Candidatus Wunengus sp. YC65 TaxID=3367701 RepID=UPI001DBA9B41|nr:response regulator [Planctomycetota bacterium]